MIEWANGLCERVNEGCTSEEEAFDFVCMAMSIFRYLIADRSVALDLAVMDAAKTMRAAELMYKQMTKGRAN